MGGNLPLSARAASASVPSDALTAASPRNDQRIAANNSVRAVHISTISTRHAMDRTAGGPPRRRGGVGRNRASDSGTVEAWDSRTRPERAPERLAEERRLARQVGPGGWFPRNEQPRDARRREFPVARKKGGTAGADASRPFGPDAAHVAPAGTGRPVDVRNRRGFVMFEASAASDPRPCRTRYPV